LPRLLSAELGNLILVAVRTKNEERPLAIWKETAFEKNLRRVPQEEVRTGARRRIHVALRGR